MAKAWYSKMDLELYPELRHFSSSSELKPVRRKFAKIVFMNPTLWCCAIGMVAVAIGGAIGLWHLGLGMPYILCTQASLMFGFVWVFRWGFKRTLGLKVRACLRERLLELGIPVCANCCYNLAGNASDICPECGKAIPNEVMRAIGDAERCG